MAERITNQDASEMAKAIMAKAEQGRREFAERTGCSCCDPTSPSPDPVVVRLEAEVEELKRQLADAQCQLVASHPEAWANITKRLTDERDEAREDVTRLNARLLQIHTAAGEAVANPPSPIDAYRILKDDNARLRGLLREACEYAKADESDWKAWYPRFIPEDWCDRAQAALEGKP